MKARKWLRIVVFGLVALATLAALVLSVSSYNSRREWAKTKADLIGRGEKLSLVELAPPPIPDEQNFYADPIWLELADRPNPESDGPIERASLHTNEWAFKILNESLAPEQIGEISMRYPHMGIPANPTRINIARAISNRSGDELPEDAAGGLALLEPLRPISEKIIELLRRPSARFPILYEEGFGANFHHLVFIFRLSDLFTVRARLELAFGNTHEASADIVNALNLARTLDNEPMLISQISNSAVRSRAYNVIETGIAHHLWTGAELQSFEQTLSKISPIKNLVVALRGERAGCNTTIEAALRSGNPSGLFRALPSDSDDSAPTESQRKLMQLITRVYLTRDQALYNNLIQSCIDEIDSANKTGISREVLSQLGDKARSAPGKFLYPLTKMCFDPLAQAVTRSLQGEENLRLLTVACALERYRIANHAYPETLDQLVPQYLKEVPTGVLAGQSLKYRESNGRFLLWTAGWDGVDENGKSSRGKPEIGDWVCDPWLVNR